MPGTRSTTTLPGGGVAVQLDQLLAAIGVTDWVYLSGRVEVQCTGVATAVTIQPERSTADPAGAANPAPVGAPTSGNPSAGMQVLVNDEAGAAWWRLRVTAITGASVSISISGRGASTPAGIVTDRSVSPKLQRLKLSTLLATAGSAFTAEVLNRTAGSELRLSRNPGDRYQLTGTTLTGKGLSYGIDTPVITEYPGSTGAIGALDSEFHIRIAHDPSVPAFTRSWAGSVDPAPALNGTLIAGVAATTQTIANAPVTGALTLLINGAASGLTAAASGATRAVTGTAGAAGALTIGETGQVVGVVGAQLSFAGTPLKGYALTGAGGVAPYVLQERTTAGGNFSDIAGSLPFTPLSVNVGRSYRLRDFSGAYSSETGTIGISDTVDGVTAYARFGRYIININTDGVGKAAGKIRGTDYGSQMFVAADDMTQILWRWKTSAALGNQNDVLNYMHQRWGRYTDDAAETAYLPGVQISELGPVSVPWNLVEKAGSSANRQYLGETYISTDPNSTAVAARMAEIGVLPFCSPSGYNYFTADGSVVQLGQHLNQGVTWNLAAAPGPTNTVAPGAPYIVAIAPGNEQRMSGTFRMDKYYNALIAMGRIDGGNFFNGWAGGLEITREGASQGEISGKGFPTLAELNIAAATPYTFDTDVANLMARCTNKPGFEVRKAMDIMILTLKANSILALIDDLNFLHVLGARDWRRAFKSASHDIVDRIAFAATTTGGSANLTGVTAGALYAGQSVTGPGIPAGTTVVSASGTTAVLSAAATAGATIVGVGTGSATYGRYVPTGGVSYDGIGFGGTNFNPATAGGQFQQNSAYQFGFVESDPGTVGAQYFGNLTARLGRSQSGNGTSQLNDAGQSGGTPNFTGGYTPLPAGYSSRRVAGASPEGTGGSAGYQRRKTGSATSNADPTQVSTALTSGEFELGRGGSGLVYSQAVISMVAYGGGLTATQTDIFHTAYMTMRAAAKDAGI